MGVGDPIARQTKLNMGGSDPHVSQRFVLGDRRHHVTRSTQRPSRRNEGRQLWTPIAQNAIHQSVLYYILS